MVKKIMTNENIKTYQSLMENIEKIKCETDKYHTLTTNEYAKVVENNGKLLSNVSKLEILVKVLVSKIKNYQGENKMLRNDMCLEIKNYQKENEILRDDINSLKQELEKSNTDIGMKVIRQLRIAFRMNKT